MVEPITINVRHLSQDVHLPQEQVQAAIECLDAGFPIPFIVRYRKEVTQNLGEESLRHIAEELRTARSFCERKQTILKTIEAAGKLTPELDKSIRDAKSVKRLEDIYLPYKPKRQQLAPAARDGGLEPFALELLEGTLLPEQVDARAAEFINEEKGVKSVADVLFGAGHIIADVYSCKAELVHKVRELLYQHGVLTTKRIERPGEKTAEKESGVRSQESGESATDTRETATVSAETASPEEVTEAIETEVSETKSDAEITEKPSETEESPAAFPGDTVAGSLPPDDSQEITALFEQHKAEQIEKGIPKILSQNALKKKKRAEAKKKQEEIKQQQRNHFERQFAEYFDYSVKLRGIPAHRILSFNRGERHKVLHVAIHIDVSKVLEAVKEICVPPEHVHADFLTGCLQDALQRGVLPTLIREVREEMTEYAERHAIKVFGQNLRHLLLQRPLLNKRVLALDPGGKNGCKVVALDEFGNLLQHETLFLAVKPERRNQIERILAEMIRKFGISVIAIGIGGGSRMAEEIAAHMIETHFTQSDGTGSELAYIMINKTGSISYSTSQIAKEEFPREESATRAAISIGRRLQNPLNELVKIEPANLGLGSFQLDIRGKHIKKMLDEVVESCVNAVGVDVNRATTSHLSYIAGLNPMTARRIHEYRREHGAFRTREDLRKVPGINATVYTHAAGFLRIAGGDNPLDSTNIHPESYELAASIIEKLGFSVNDLRSGDKMKVIAENIGELTVKLSSELNVAVGAVRDILEELANPGRDPRESQPPLMLRRSPLKIEHLTPGMELIGTVLNVAEFGAFVDIGLHESGFVHISQMSTGFIRSAHEKAAAGNTLRLWVVEADIAKKRVSLSLLPPGTERQQPRSRDRDRSERPPRPEGEGGRRQEAGGRGDRPHRDSQRDSRGGGRRFERKPFDRSPKTFVTAPVKKEVKPITDKMKEGKEPMRSFSDLAQLFGRAPTDGEGGEKKR